MASLVLAFLLAFAFHPAWAEGQHSLRSTIQSAEAEDSDDGLETTGSTSAPSPSPTPSFNERWQAPESPTAPFKDRWPAAGGLSKGCQQLGCVNLPKLPAPDFRAIPQGPQRRTAFLNYFGPQAVMLHKATGYPASLMLAQWAQESGWGSSDNYVAFNNIAGHRCWKNGQVETIKVRVPGRAKNVRRTCQLKEGSSILYWKFENPLDATLAYLDNLLYCEDTAKSYQSIRAEVARSKEQGVQWQKLMPGLSEYCPWNSYQIEVPQLLRQNRLESWDGKRVCSCS